MRCGWIAVHTIVLTVCASGGLYASNILIDGSFEAATGTASFNAPGAGTLTGTLPGSASWRVTTSGTPDGGAVIVRYTTITYCGETIAPDSISTGPAAAAGIHGLYFYNDSGTVNISQSVSLVAGLNYHAGWDLLRVHSGSGSAANPLVTLSLAGITLGTVNLLTLPAPATATDATAWRHFDYTYTAPSTGIYQLMIAFQGTGSTGKDLAIDRVYLDNGVPEPASFALAVAGVACVALVARRNAATRRR